MTKFKVLEYNRKYMTFIGIYSNRLTEPTNEFFKSFFTYYILAAVTSCLLTSGTFFLRYHAYEVKPALGAFKIVFSGIQCGGMFLGIGLKMVIVKSLHLELQRIVDDAEGKSELNTIYWECEQKCRKLTQRFSYFVIFHTSAFTIGLTYALICIAFGNYDTSRWYLPFAMVSPFDQTSVVGWILTWMIQVSEAISYALPMSLVTSYFVSCCYYINSMVEHTNLMINSVTTDVERMQSEKSSGQIGTLRYRLITQLSNVVIIHNKIYDISIMLAEICSPCIFALLPANAIFLSVSMYDVEVSVTNFDSSALLWDITCILCGLVWPAIISHYATFISDRVSSIGEMAYDSNWPDYPPYLGKHIILITARSQHPVFFHGLGLVGCNREVFGRICRASSSYYITFRAIDQR